MIGLQASYFRRIYKGLLLDLILTIVSPIVIIILGYLVSGQMEAAGLAVGEMSFADAALLPRIVTRLMYAYLVLLYCLGQRLGGGGKLFPVFPSIPAMVCGFDDPERGRHGVAHRLCADG